MCMPCLPLPCLPQNMSLMGNAAAVIELARIDTSMSTFLLVHSYLAMLTIGLLVSTAFLGAVSHGCHLIV